MKRTTITPSSPVAPCPFECTPAPQFPGKATVTPCTEPPQDNGWCHAHQYAARVLEVAQSYGCPRLEVLTTVKRYDAETRKEVSEQVGLIVGRGMENWRAVCVRVTPEHARKIEAVLEREYAGMYSQKGQVA